MSPVCFVTYLPGPYPTFFAFRVPHTNSLTPTPSHTQSAIRDPRAGPAGGPELPDTL